MYRTVARQALLFGGDGCGLENLPDKKIIT